MQFFYEAKDSTGKQVSGSLDAPNSVEAIRLLRERGFDGPRLMSSDVVAVLRSDLEKLTPDEVQRHAQVEMAAIRARTQIDIYLSGMWG